MMETGTQTITTIHVVLMAVLAVLVVIGLVYGARLKRRRKAGQDALEVRAEEAGVQISQPDDHGEQPPSPPEPAAEPTLAPSPPPPIADTPAPRPEPTPEPTSEAVPARDPIADEPIAAAAPLEASPAAEAAPPAASPAVPAQGRAIAAADAPVTLLKGLGPKVGARLADLGITTVGQIAALDAADAQALDSQLGTFAGRMARDRWIEQARFLAAGDKAGFEAAFGKL